MDALDHGEGFLRLNQVLERIPVSKRSWYRGIRAGRFPRPIKLGPSTTVWRVEDIRALISKLGTEGSSARECS
ncbi:MAG: AlpA family phage regulatory protein [Pseudomonadota bacterium]